jgi:hypothetical protein
MKATLISLAFLMLLISPRLAMGCSCGRTPAICESFAAAEAVFVGTVSRVENKTVKMPNGQEGIVGQTAYVQVEESFKGAKESEMIFRSYGSSCDAVYKEGQRRLFYAYFNKDDKAWQIHGCDRSTSIEWAADDLLYLRNLPASAQKTRISGIVINSAYKPMMGIKVKVTDGKQVYKTFTDKNGVYELVGLPPGKYSAEPEVPLNMTLNYPSHAGDVDYSNRLSPRIVLKEKSCAGVNFYFAENTFISGKVFGVDGRPLKDVCVHLRLKEKPETTRYLGSCTKPDGSFKINQIPLGDYFLIANEGGKITSSEPFPTLYFPGVFEKEKATVLTIADGDQREDFDIHVPSQRATRTVEGRVLYSDGRPGANESVDFKAESQGSSGGETVNAVTDAEGRFSFPVLEGLKGSLRAYLYTYGGEAERCPQLKKFIKVKDTRSVELETNVIKLEMNVDYKDLELKFPFTNCPKEKEPQ